MDPGVFRIHRTTNEHFLEHVGKEARAVTVDHKTQRKRVIL